MSGRFLSLLGLLFSFQLLGCAQPKYLSPSTDKGAETAGENQLTCSHKFLNSALCLTWAWEKIPTESEMGQLVFKISRANVYDGTPVEVDTSALPQVVLWMPSMGHGSSPTMTSRLDVGTYRAANVFFIMPGEWEIKFQIKEGDTLQDEAVIRVDI